MALPPELQDEVKKLAGLPETPALEQDMQEHADEAASRQQGGHITKIFNSVIIGSENLSDAERLAQAYAASLIQNKLVEENKVKTLDWKTVFNNAAGRPYDMAIADNLAQAFHDAEGGVLIIKEPYQCPWDMSPRDFSLKNYEATKQLMDKIVETDKDFDAAIEALIEKGKNLNEIEGQIYGQDFSKPRNPAVILVGRNWELESMIAEDAYPWNARFMHRIGVSDSAFAGVKPKHRKPAP